MRQGVPRFQVIQSNASSAQLLVHGQGVFVFECFSPTTLRLMNTNNTNGILINLTSTCIDAVRIPDNIALKDVSNVFGLSSEPGAYYWVSLDSQNQTLQVGVGEPRMETTVYSYKFSNDIAFLEQLTSIYFDQTVMPQRLLRDPITKNVPVLVKNTDDLTMDDVASGRVMPQANLNLVSQKLYDCIRGTKFVLDDESFPEFSAAIERSIANPNGWCYKRLQEKSREFNPNVPNPTETYLRITLGGNNGESPGIPYVMEIWPVGHYSPIHSHSQANAVIRVLHGSIHVTLYPFLCATKSGVKPFAVADFHKDDITWISPTLNKTHQLLNLPTNTSTCITIQCYMYDNDDTQHYDYFDYIDVDGNKKQYTPDSDMDFMDFKALMKKEYLEQ